ncbi:MAG: PA2169 family four-helix-bundle protein [Pseudomonadota bacterium]
MDSTHHHAVKVLNSLIETTLDSANGYKEAAENADSSQYKTMFAQRSQKRLEITRELQAEVRTFGGEPEDDQSLLGKAHNKFVDLKAALTGGHDDKAVITEVERGEDFIKGKYEHALKDDDLPPTARQAVERAYVTIKADHDEVSALKHSLN